MGPRPGLPVRSRAHLARRPARRARPAAHRRRASGRAGRPRLTAVPVDGAIAGTIGRVSGTPTSASSPAASTAPATPATQAAPASRWSPSVVVPRLPGLILGLVLFGIGIALMAEAG